MKAVLTGGGRALRLRPITHTWNKHLIPLANKPMIFHAIEKVVDAGITDIAINMNPGETELPKAVGDGSRWGATIHFFEQQGGPLGIANVPKQAEAWINGDKFLFYLSDNIVLGNIRAFVRRFQDENHDAMMALSRVRDPQRFGVPEFAGEKIVRLDEKPSQPKSDFAVTGLYLFNNDFFRAYDTLKPSARGEYEITDIYNWYLAQNKKVGHAEITGWWKDTGKPEDLLEGNQLLLDEMTMDQATRAGAEIAPGATIQGKVKIGAGSKIGPEVLIRGPVSIGERCMIERSVIGPYSSIGSGCTVRNAEIEHCILFDNVEVNCHDRIVDSIIGKDARITNKQGNRPWGRKLIIGDNAHVEI